MFESFITYQQKLAKEFIVLKKKYGLTLVNGNYSIEETHKRLEKQISKYLSKVS
jgi:hypothetical protein